MTPLIRVLLDPANPNDFTAAELAPLVQRIESDVADSEVTPVFRDEVGYGGPWIEVLHVWIDVADSIDAAAVSVALLRHVTKFLKTRFESDAQQPGELGPPRPSLVNIYGPDGRILKSVQIDENGVAEQAVDPTATAPHPRPS